jgi:hypothetical protein
MIEDTLNGGYAGLYGEVVTQDCYRLKTLDFVPEIILDLGANVGVFHNYARKLFPEATIICVEPDFDNFSNLVAFSKHDKSMFFPFGIGPHILKRVGIGINGAHEIYLKEGDGREVVGIQLSYFSYPDKKVLIKIDIEGAEKYIFEHKESVEVMKDADYIAMELHRSEKENKADILFLEETHNLEYVHPMAYARKKC